MGSGRTCEVCSELASLLSSYDGKRTSLTSYDDISISREEVETILLYMVSWSQRQCSCCFRSDHKHFERFNWALQILILVVVEIIKRFGTQSQEAAAPVTESPPSPRPLWDFDDKDKLVHFVSKLFTNSFPTYIGYKTHSGGKLSDSELSPAEVHNLSQYCEINESEAPPYLYRNIGLFCRSGGMEALTICLQNNTPETLALHRMNMLVSLASNVKSWLNFNALLKLYVPFRSAALGYMCALVETELKTGTARNMAEYIWSSVKDPVDAHLSFDKDGLDLAFRYFLCPTLTMRLAGVNQINNYINLFNELLNSEHMREPDRLYESLCGWLLSNQVVDHIFGPNLHVEVIKQSHTILSFLAMENRLTEEHVEIIWTAAQLKHCSKPVFDVLSSLIPHMEPGPVLHLHHLLQKLEPKDHSEQSLYLASALIKFIWTNATNAMEEANTLTTSIPLGSGGSLVSVPASSSSPSNNGLQFHHHRVGRHHHHHHHSGSRRRAAVRGGDVSSSENSVSVEGSEEEEEEDEDEENHHHSRHHHRAQGQRLIRPLSQLKQMESDEEEPISPTASFLKPTCHLSGESSTSDESLSEEEEDDEEDEDGVRSEKGGCSSSGGGGGGSTPYVETHSDSDADEDEPENEVLGGKIIIKKRKVLRRKAASPVKNVTTPKGQTRVTTGPPRVVKMVHNNKPVSNTSSHGDHKLQQVPEASPSTLSDAVVPNQSLLTTFYAKTGTTGDISDGSYSSRMSNKSDKNMADFDGEESPPEDVDLMASLTHSQLAEMATRVQTSQNLTPQQLQPQYVQQQLLDPNIVLTVGGLQQVGSNRNKTQVGPGSGSTTLLLPPRAMRMFFRRKRFQSVSSFNFKIDDVIEPGVTLLWDLIQDDKIVQLSDGLAIEAQKALSNLLCFGADKAIRLKFVEGCIRNVAANQAVVVSLRILPKLLSSFNNVNQMRLPNGSGDSHQVTLWAVREHAMLDKLFANLQTLKNNADLVSTSPFPYHAHVQARLDFLSAVFSSMGSPDDFRLSVAQVDTLWECLARDPKCSDDLFVWLTNQVRSRDQHALSHETFRHILMAKLPSHPPESITMHSLTLFQQLCNLARLAVLQDVELVAGGTPVASMDYLWKIALYAHNTDVSLMAIQYLNNYYIGRQLEKEEEFVERCMSHLAEATTELVSSSSSSDESPLLRIQRALLLLKSHLEMFRRRYAYHLRKWAIEGCGVGCHAQLVGDKGALPLRVVIQPASYHEKVTLELTTSDYVADLRAEVAKWWERVAGGGGSDKTSTSTTPVLGSLLAEGPIRMITQGIELSADFDEKFIGEVPIKDLQIVYVSMGASRPTSRNKGRDSSTSQSSPSCGVDYSSSLPPPPRDKLPVTLLLQPTHFEALFSLMQSLAEIKTGSGPHTKAQVLSRRVWDILMLLPTNPEIHAGFKNTGDDFRSLLDPSSPQKLMYSLYIVEALVKMNSNPQSLDDEAAATVLPWRQRFVSQGGLRHLFGIFTSGVLEFSEGGKDWSEWKQDCLASLLKILCYLGVVPEETEHLSELLYDVNEAPKKRVKRRKGSATEKTPIPRLNETMISVMELELVMPRLTFILQACSHPRDPNAYKTGFWGRAQVVHYAMALLICWSFSHRAVRATLYSQPGFSTWLRKLVLEDPEPVVRREICMGLYRLCLGISTEGNTGLDAVPQLIAHLLTSLSASLNIRWTAVSASSSSLSSIEDGKEPYGPACRDYFWLLGRLLDSLDETTVRESIQKPEASAVDLDTLAVNLRQAIVTRDYLETRHNTVCDDGLVGLLTVMNVVMKHNPPFKSSPAGQRFLKEVFDTLFCLPSPSQRYLPKCKSPPARSAAYDLLAEMARCCPDNYFQLGTLLLEQHGTESHTPYVWDYWPHEDGRAICGFVGLTNLGATCYMAACMQHLYMMPPARGAILGAKFNQEANRHEPTLRELQRMFAYLMESERKAFNPRGFCKMYQMDHKPLNTGEQKDMAEFFIDLVSKLEEMTPELRKLVKNLFCGVTSNNVVSLDCPHVSRTLEEFYTVRCQVADMRNLYESLDEVTVKDTLEGDNMYTCSTCGKKVRAEKRACFKKLPKVICFNTMRYTFNMITMMKEKVNTHFSFPIQLDMSGYVEKTLMPQQYAEERANSTSSGGNDGVDLEEECCTYDLIGVTVHTGTADGGHYYSFIRDRLPPNRDKWYLFNDAEVKQFDPNQLPAECFGGEMSTKTYDSVTDKFLDFSFEKTNSAYMLFYERSPIPKDAMSAMVLAAQSMSLPGGSSSSSQHHNRVPVPMPSPTIMSTIPAVEVPTFELSKELEDWIWMDNTQFLQDKNIFEHTYFNFMSQVCCQIPVTLHGQEQVMILAAKLSSTFFLETFIHAKEKPTMIQWMELLTKQLVMSPSAAAWFLETMASPENSWLPQILLKCPNQLVRSMFGRLCFHVVQNLRPHQLNLYSKMPDGMEFDHPDDIQMLEFGSFSCVAKFIQRYLSLLDQSAKPSLKNLAEYFTFLHDFTKLGDEECLLLIHLQAISRMVNFYMGSKREQAIERGELGSEEEEEEEEIISIPTEKSKVASLEKMIALIATLVEKSRDESNVLKLSRSDREALMSPRKATIHFQMFPFILQQIRDGINYNQSRNLIFSLSRWNEKLAEDIVIAIFQAINKHPDMCHPYFKVLNLLAELVSGPVGMPKFTELILSRIMEVAEICPYPTLEWLGAQVPRNKVVHSWCLSSLGTWVEHFLMGNNNQRVRNAAASLLVSLVPSLPFRQGYRSTKVYGMGNVASRELVPLTGEALGVLHDIYHRLLQLLKPARHYTEINSQGTSKLVAYFGVLTYFTVSKTEKLLFGHHFLDLWNLFHPRLSEPSVPCHHNKSALLTFWLHACTDCPENIQRITSNPAVVKQIGFNYILADHEDQEVVMFNRTMLPAYYSIMRMCCTQNRAFAVTLARHQNITWAFKNISPYQTQYPAAVDELFKLMQIISQRHPDATEAEAEEVGAFRKNAILLYLNNLDVRSSYGTLISALRILIETVEDRVYFVLHNGLIVLLEAINMIHTMHHEATACHVTGELVDLLSLLSDILRTFRPKEFAHGMSQQGTSASSDVPIQRFISACKEWPEVLRKLATLLNTYNCADLRNSATDALTEFLYTMPMDTLRTLVPLMVHWHTACQDAQTSGMGPTLGPYFPKRSSHGGGGPLKHTIRPPRPMLQMAFPHLGQETAKGLDEEYDRQLQEFYGQYHFYVDLMCRVAFMKDAVNQELITLSAMLGYEAAPLHFIHFPKLWLEVYNTPSIDRKYITMLVNTTYFTDYVEYVILEERTCLTNIVIFNFLATYFPKIFDKIATTDQICKQLVSIKLDLQNLVHKKIMDVETLAMGILGDLKVISLFYLPTINRKGSTQTPLPAPAPTIPSLLSALRQLNSYLESLLVTTLSSTISVGTSRGEAGSESSPGGGETPAKKRKLSPTITTENQDNINITLSDPQPGTSASSLSSSSDRTVPSGSTCSGCSNSTSSTSSSSSSTNSFLLFSKEVATQKRFITRDLINLLLGTIDTLVRGISPPSGIPDEEEDNDDDDDGMDTQSPPDEKKKPDGDNKEEAGQEETKPETEEIQNKN